MNNTPSTPDFGEEFSKVDLGARMFALERKRQPRRPVADGIKTTCHIIGGSLALTFGIALICAMLGLKFSFTVVMLMPVLVAAGLVALVWHFKNVKQPRIRIEVHQLGLQIYHPVGVLHFLRGTSTIHFTDIEKVTTQDQAGFIAFLLPLYRIIKPMAASGIEYNSSRNLVIHRKSARNITLMFWEDFYSDQSMQNFLNTLKRHHIKVSISRY